VENKTGSIIFYVNASLAIKFGACRGAIVPLHLSEPFHVEVVASTKNISVKQNSWAPYNVIIFDLRVKQLLS